MGSVTDYRRIAALGSSFAAGPGIEPIVDAVAMRSGRNYPSLLAARLGAELIDLTVSGASTATILDEPQVTLSGATVPPQIDGLPADSELVTITAGGNDLGFLGAMLAAAWTTHDPASPVTAMLRQVSPDGVPVPTPDDLERTVAGLARVVAEVKRRAPDARIVLVDYLTIIGPNTTSSDSVPISPADLVALGRVQDSLRAATGIAAVRSGADLFAASTISGGHALGDPEPWVFDFIADPVRTGASFHPNADGMAAIADALADRLLAG